MAAGGILRRIGIALGVDVEEENAKKSIEGLKSFAAKALGAIAVGVSIANLNSIANEFGAVNRIIKDATRDLGEQTDIQNKILAAANRTKTAYSDTARVVSALVRENTELFGAIDDAIQFNNAATQLFKAAGKTNDEIAGLMEAINKSFAKGAVDSETISQLLEQSPEAVVLLEKKLGTTKDQLEQMASDGKISLKALKEAFTDSADEIQKRFDETGVSVNDAILNMRNQWGLYVSQIWSGAGISQKTGKLIMRAFNEFMSVLRKAQPGITTILTTAMNWLERIADGISRAGSFLGQLTEKIGGVGNALKLLIVVAAAIWLLLNFGAMVESVKALKTAILGLFNIKSAAIVAIIALVILLIEDFIGFLQGKDSVIGAVFDRLGIGADNARTAILNAFGKVASFISNHGAEIKTIIAAIITLFGAYKAAVLIATLAQATWAAGSAIAAGAAGALGTAIAALTSPIGIVILIIGALIAVGILLYQNWDLVRAKATEIWNGILETISAVVSGIKQKAGEIKAALQEKVQAAIDWIKGLPSEALTWGADIVDGIANGIKGAAGKVEDAVRGIADKIKSFLHFSVPDEGPLTDYESWMPDFVGGLARSLRGSKGRLTQAVADVSTALNIKPTVRTIVNATGAGREGRTINQRVEINNTVQTTDRNAGKEASKQMEKSGDDVTKTITRGLAYGRA